MSHLRSNTRVGVYVDVANIARNGGYGMRYDVLREFACRGDAEPVRLNAYVTYDFDRAEQDYEYRENQNNFFSMLRDFGYKVIEKHVKWYIDDKGNRFGKANADLDMAVDALLQSKNIENVLLATGDGDFTRVVQAMQNSGCRVEIVAFENVSGELRREADVFMSGYLVPNLLPSVQASKSGPAWGEIGSRVRGVCYMHSGKGFGFLRFMRVIDTDLWKVDSRQPGSPYEAVFFHDSQLPPEVNYKELPSRNIILEFDLAHAENGEDGMQAKNMTLVSPQRRPVSNNNTSTPRAEETPEKQA